MVSEIAIESHLQALPPSTEFLVEGIKVSRVLALIHERIRTPGAFPERKLGLVVEGGAMRGVYTGGALLGLHLAGATCVFDAAYGTSSGAVNLAHFLSGEGHRKAATYYRALNTGEFYHPWRLRRIVDVDFFVDRVLRDIIPLEIEKTLAHGTPLMVALLNCTDGRGEVMRLPRDVGRAWDIIQAAVAMPVVYNRTVTIDGKRYADGGLPIPFPLRAALDDGCTDILVLRSTDPRVAVSSRFWIFSHLYSWMFARGDNRLMELYHAWADTSNELSALAAGRRPVPEGVAIATIAPAFPQVRGSTMDGQILRAGCHQMARGTLKLLGKGTEDLEELIRTDVV